MEAARVLDVLALARAFVAAGWTQGTLARTAREGILFDSFNRHAESWCLLGAVQAAACQIGEDPRPTWELLAAVNKRIESSDNLVAYNDDPATTKRQVLALFDQAAARVGGK